MTTIINFYGAPSSGKSTEAAKLFALMKSDGKNVELVTEYAKEWAWEQRSVGMFDQLFIVANQIQRETRLFGQVDTIITDSPVLLGVFYEEYRKFPSLTRDMVNQYHKCLQSFGVLHENHWLETRPSEDTMGRYHGAKECEKISSQLRRFLEDCGLSFIS